MIEIEAVREFRASRIRPKTCTKKQAPLAAWGARAAVEEGKRIAREENSAYAASQAVGRALHKLRGDR